ncbi:MAG: diphthamide biosynthesis enzyme Dph2 [Methanomicrobiales archaeon]|nr:diphthamide biosynthesis enzyme Dph2 [Methanomicrobiales archaeon]
MYSIPVSDLVRKLRQRHVSKVALQFPDGLRRRAFAVASSLREEGFEVIVSGDPCYGSCDLATDTLALADILVHFGHAPVENREGIIYEYVSLDLDPAILDAAVPLFEGREIGIVTTVQHAHLIDAMAERLRSQGFVCRIASPGGRTPLPGQILGCTFEAARMTGAPEILYVGTGMFHPLGVRLATGARVVALDPYTGIASLVDADRLLRKRYARIESARQASTIGILVSLKSGQQRFDLARRLETLDSRAFLITMREITPEGLLNLGCDCYVNTACPRLAYDDQIRFPAPVLSPPEYEIACGVRAWDEYTIDEIT